MTGCVEHYQSLEPQRYLLLRKLEFIDDSVGHVYSQSLVLTFSGSSEATLQVRCGSVRQLEFTPVGSEMRLHFLDVEEVRAHQLEGINFEIRDCEHEFLAFGCQTFEARLIHDDS